MKRLAGLFIVFSTLLMLGMNESSAQETKRLNEDKDVCIPLSDIIDVWSIQLDARYVKGEKKMLADVRYYDMMALEEVKFVWYCQGAPSQIETIWPRTYVTFFNITIPQSKVIRVDVQLNHPTKIGHHIVEFVEVW